MSPLSLLSLAAAATALTVDTGTLLYNFSTSAQLDLENAVLRPNGQLLMVPISNAYIYNLDPSAPSPSPTIVATLPGVDSVQGIASLGDDKYAVTAGIRGSSAYTNETVFTLDFSEALANGTVVPTPVMQVPAAQNFNGLIALPESDDVVLAADCLLGAIWRINLGAATAEQITIANNSLLAVPTTGAAGLPSLGIDGLKLYTNTTTGQLYAYFTNVAQLLFGRLPLNANATAATGPAEIVTTQSGTDNWDDFAIAADAGLAFGAMNPDYVQMVDLDTGAASIVAELNGTTEGPTSVVLKGDGTTAYAFTRDGMVFEVELPAY